MSSLTSPAFVTGLSINTPLGDTLDGVFDAMLEGKSAVTAWKAFPTDAILAKIGANLTDYDVAAKLAALAPKIPAEMHARAQKLLRKVPWSTKLSILVAIDAWLDAKADGADGAPFDPTRIGVIVASSDIGLNYEFDQFREFAGEPDFIDPLYPVHSLDTDHAGCVSEVLGAKGGAWVIGGACASGNLGLKQAVDEVLHHDLDAVFLVGPAYEFSPIYLHGLGLMGAISTESFNDEPHRASRPFDTSREGFVPAHGAATVVVESAKSASRRGVQRRAEIVKVASTSDGNHLPHPNLDGQIGLLEKLFRGCRVKPEEIDFVSAHATSTPAGDVVEIEALSRFFKGHAKKLVINAPKSLLGHACGSTAVVETVIAVLELERQRIHGSINVDELDPKIDLDVAPNKARDLAIRHVLKNSFGFGGINCSAILSTPTT